MKFPTFPGSPYVARYDLAKGRGRFESTHREEDRHMWRVPTLRNLGYTTSVSAPADMMDVALGVGVAQAPAEPDSVVR